MATGAPSVGGIDWNLCSSREADVTELLFGGDQVVESVLRWNSTNFSPSFRPSVELMSLFGVVFRATWACDVTASQPFTCSVCKGANGVPIEKF